VNGVTRLSQRLLPNHNLKFYQIGFFFYQTRANSAFWNFWLRAVIVVTCYTLFGFFHGDSITKPSNNHVNIISNTFLDIQGMKFIFFLGIQLGYQDSKFSIPPENPVSHFWIMVTGTISIIPCPIQISFHNSRYYYKLQY
jgi:hypothetical protein